MTYVATYGIYRDGHIAYADDFIIEADTIEEAKTEAKALESTIEADLRGRELEYFEMEEIDQEPSDWVAMLGEVIEE